MFFFPIFFFFQNLRMIGINPSLNIWKNSPMKLSGSGISLLGGFEYWLNVLNHYWSDQVFYYFMIHSLDVVCFLEVIQLSIQSSLLWPFFISVASILMSPFSEFIAYSLIFLGLARCSSIKKKSSFDFLNCFSSLFHLFLLYSFFFF